MSPDHLNPYRDSFYVQTDLNPMKLSRSHRFLQAWQRLVDLKVLNPSGKGSDDQDG